MKTYKISYGNHKECSVNIDANNITEAIKKAFIKHNINEDTITMVECIGVYVITCA